MIVHPKKWLAIKPQGLYCIPGGFFIDPLVPVETAIVTHGHADHARAGHKKVLATPETLAIMKIRYGEECALELVALEYYQRHSINKVLIYLLPAGHILGSAQLVVEYGESRLIISGDYKRSVDPTCGLFKAEPCDVFITEATFGLPIFKHPPIEKELEKLLDSLKNFPEYTHLVGVYALGKCQRIIKTLRLMRYTEKIYLHGAMIKLCNLYQSLGIDLGDIEAISQLKKNETNGKIILCPPSALHDRWSRRFSPSIIAHASGWMRIRARAKQKGIDLPLIISDHADWTELTTTIKEIDPQEVWVTHGREEALVYYATQQGYQSQALYLLGYEEEDD